MEALDAQIGVITTKSAESKGQMCASCPHCGLHHMWNVQLRLDAAATAAIEAFHVCPSLDILVPTLMQYGAEQLHEHIALTPGT